ncbi:4'-phosphopantetheinyl transferase family protein [Frondihabitans cladoniiphilus]|uniref:4'-phosphopantetheinyl transferase domain-containing protein n=1 Tax=Frondihabitans cladoniiphilus TaxID=715785 RepID=A0ABP8VHG9_9MICO
MGTLMWLVDLDAEGGDEAAASAAHPWLDEAERARAAALTEADDRRRYVQAHLVLRRLLGEARGVLPAEVRIPRSPCLACGDLHGRPVVPGGPHFSLSRSGRWAAIAIDEDARVGIDIEIAQAASRLEPLRSELLSDGETAGPDGLLRLWVRKEAYLKATGAGLTRPMSTVGADELRAVVDLELPDGLVGALATLPTGTGR